MFYTNLLHRASPEERGPADVERATAALQDALQCCRDTGHATTPCCWASRNYRHITYSLSWLQTYLLVY